MFRRGKLIIVIYPYSFFPAVGGGLAGGRGEGRREYRRGGYRRR